MRVHPIFANFTAGELSPLLYGRVDFEKYANGAKQLVNMFVRPHGPAERRAGTHFVAEVKDSTKKVALLRFEFSVEQAYIIEFGHLYMRFYKDGGRIESPPGTPVEIATPYTETQLFDVKYIQSADTVYLFHKDQPVYKLIRYSHTSWALKAVNFLPPATYEDGFTSASTLTFGATTGLGVTCTASSAIFLESDVNRMITVGDGRASIRAIGGVGPQATCTVDIVDTLPSVGPHTAYTIAGTPATTLTPSATGPRHAIITLNLDANGWRAGVHEGKYVRVNRGIVRITRITNYTIAEGEVLSMLSSAGAASVGSWSLEAAAWSADRGYPQTGCFHEQRLVVAGSQAQPQTIWGSSSADYENMGLGADDDDAFEFRIAANDVNAVRWLVPTRVLLIGTASTEFTMRGANDSAITPLNVDVKAESQWGSGTVRPIRVASAALFTTRWGRDVRELMYSFQRDQYMANNIILLSEHLARTYGITDMAYQRTPHSIVWCTRSDGALLTLTYQPDHNVIAWSRSYTGQDVPTAGSPMKGKFEAVAVIPHWNGDREVAWFVVNRNINGVQKRYIEYMDETSGFYGELNTDSALTYLGAPATSVSGLNHLEGETVQIVGDGAVYPPKTVTAGAVALSGPPASKIEVGLPYYSLLESMRPEVPVQGTSQGRMKHWSEIIVRLEESLGCYVNGEEIPFRSSTDLMDAPPPIFTGDRAMRNVGRDTDGTVIVEQRQPLPLTVVGIFGTLGTGE